MSEWDSQFMDYDKPQLISRVGASATPQKKTTNKDFERKHCWSLPPVLLVIYPLNPIENPSRSHSVHRR